MVTCVPIAKELHSFFVTYFMYDKGKLESLVNILLLEFYLLWDLFDPTFTQDLFAFMYHPPPLRQNPYQYSLSLPIMSSKEICACSDGSNLRTLRIQEKKSSTFQKIISLDDVLCHPHCATEVDRTKLDRVSTHVGERVNPNLSWVLI